MFEKKDLAAHRDLRDKTKTRKGESKERCGDYEHITLNAEAIWKGTIQRSWDNYSIRPLP